MKYHFLAAIALMISQTFGQPAYFIRSDGLEAGLTGEGVLNTIRKINSDHGIRVRAATSLAGCTQGGPLQMQSLPAGSFQFTRTLTSQSHSCIVTDRFSPDGAAIRWDVEIEGTGEPWTTEIETQMSVEDTEHAGFWTPWGNPDQLSPVNWGEEPREWHNPFETRPFRDMHLVYGGHFGKGAGYALPLFSIMYPQHHIGLTLAMSPHDRLLEVHMITSRGGTVTEKRRFHRIQKGKTLRFSMLLYLHNPDWRSVLAFMVERYPGYFYPEAEHALSLCGLGAYSSYEGELDADLYRRMGGIVNWKASFDFSYMGQFLPPVETDTTQWKRFSVTSEGAWVPGESTCTSIREMSNYAKRMKMMGFSTLNYFNATEFGGSSAFSDSVKYPRPEIPKEDDIWENPSAFLYDHFPNALLFPSLDHVGWHKLTPQQYMDSPVRFHERPCWTWGGAVAMDPGDSAYAAFLLQQAQRHVDKFPDAQGICIDRLDWFNEYNWHADDGESWVGGKPVRSLLNSYREFIPRLSAIMHGNGKVVFCNPHMNRIELMEHIDGIYNEFGHLGYNLNLSAFLTLFKPLIVWTPDSSWVLKSPDEFFQKFILMGAFPTAPFPGNDHTIRPDPEVDRYYLDYGPMFINLHQRCWVLLPDVVSVRDDAALCNMFSTPGKVLIPVVMGKKEAVEIIVRDCAKLLHAPTAGVQIWYPGLSEPETTTVQVADDEISIPVTLRRGCAFLVLSGL